MEMIDLQNDDLSDDANDLAKFFGILKKFNGEEDINIQFRIQIEDYFQHRWQHDKNHVFQDKYMKEFMDQVPAGV